MVCFQDPPHMIVDIAIEFLGHLRHSPGTLKQCSLVCKPWLYPSQKHLFATLRSQNGGPKRDFLHLLKFLKDHLYISSFVKDLILQNNKGEVRPRRLDLRHLHEVVCLLPALVSVQIQDLNLDAEDIFEEHQLAGTISLGPLPHIRALLLDRVGATPVDITYLLCLVSSIDTLRITDSECIAENPSCDFPSTVDLVNLRHIELTHSSLGFIQQLSETDSQLRSLSIAGDDLIAPDVLRSLMYHSSLSLRRLCLDLKNVASDVDKDQMNVLRRLDLASFRGLEELKLTIAMACVDDELHDSTLDIQWILLLGLVESSEAGRIIISLSPPQHGSESMGAPSMKRLKSPLLNDWWTVLKGLEWQNLDGCLAAKATIPEVGFMGETFGTYTPLYTREYLGDVLEENIRSKMPHMSSLGRIRFWNGDGEWDWDGSSENW